MKERILEGNYIIMLLIAVSIYALAHEADVKTKRIDTLTERVEIIEGQMDTDIDAPYIDDSTIDCEG